MENNTVYEWILQTTFTASMRQKSLEGAKPHLSTLIHPGHEVLDLCCGSGFVSFWLEDQGARAIGIDFAPYMIALAKEEASSRNSTVEFIKVEVDQGFSRSHRTLSANPFEQYRLATGCEH